MLLLRHAFLPLVALLAGLTACALSWATGGLSPSLLNPDEGGHYVNALFLGDWLRAGLPSPLAFAKEYYAHFPRLTIGHWPPGWYMLEAPVFAALRPSPAAAVSLSAVVAGLPAVVPAWGFAQLDRPRLGLALAAAYLLLPTVVDAGRFILLDQPVALVVGLAGIAWRRASQEPSWPRLLLFGALAAFAPLVKGNGALVALIPAIDIALTGRWDLLRRPALWMAGLLALLVVAPWYWLSFAIAADGFNYAPGPAYAALALRFNAAALWTEIGPGGLALVLTGAIAALRAPPLEQRLARLALAVMLATLLFQSLVPVALEPRYLSPLLPWAVMLAGLGLLLLARHARARVAALLLSAAALAWPAAALARLQPKPDLGAPTLVADLTRTGGIWLVDARAGGEGAIIAQAAWADGERHRIWIARASQWLSTSDFMGRGYRLIAPTPAAARAVLDHLGVAGAVSIAERNRLAYPHSRVLRDAIGQGGFALDDRRFRTGAGEVLLARRLAPVRPATILIGTDPGSANAGKMNAALGR